MPEQPFENDNTGEVDENAPANNNEHEQSDGEEDDDENQSQGEEEEVCYLLKLINKTCY